MYMIILYLILAFSPFLVNMCLKTKTRAWITLLVLTIIVFALHFYKIHGIKERFKI